MKQREDDLIGIRKARFASFVLLIVCFAAMFVILVLSGAGQTAYFSAVALVAVLVFCWWMYYRRLLFSEAVFFEALTKDMLAVYNWRLMLETAVRGIEDGIVVVGESGEVLLVNETAKALLAIVEEDLDEGRYDEHAAGFSPKLERNAILAGGEEGRPPERIEQGGRHYKIGYVELAQEKGRRRGAVAVITDVTEYTNVENMQKAFIDNVSHELRTPLASVRSYAETLMSDAGEDPKTREEFLGVIVDAADHMTAMVKTNLSWAQLDQTTHIEAVESDLTELTSRVMQRLGGLVRKKPLTVNRMFPDRRCPVDMDERLIEQAISNVLGNAIKYTEEKGRIDVDIIPSANCVQIVISDNGVGIPDEDISQIFDRYFRGEKSRNRAVEGTGLGLAISKKIVDLHGGTMSVESKLGSGTRVVISLPAARLRGASGIE